MNRIRNTNDAYIKTFNDQVRAGVSNQQLKLVTREVLAAEKKASSMGRVLSAGLTTVKWVGRGAMVLTVATVAADTVQAGPTEATKNFIKDATFYSVTVEPIGFWYNRTYKQAEEGKMNPDSPIGNYINNIRQFSQEDSDSKGKY